MILDATKLVPTGKRRVYTDPPTAGSIWDEAFGSDWPARACGLQLLDGLDADTPAAITPLWQSVGTRAPYQRPRVDRVDVGGRVLFLYSQGYSEGYLYYLSATEQESLDEVPPETGWERVQ